MTENRKKTPARDGAPLGGVVHTYLGYDPGRFPSPTTPPPDLASAAFEHMLRTGSSRELTPEDLANAVKIDPSQIAGLGPSIDALIETLEERKRKILETYETRGVLRDAGSGFEEAARNTQPPKRYRDAFHTAINRKQIYLLERLWYALRDDQSEFGDQLMRTLNRLGELYEIEDLDGKYEFTGSQPMTVPEAIEIKEELEAIDKLLEQLREAMKTAQIGIVDLDELKRFVSDADADQLRGMQDKVREYLERMAEEQGIDTGGGGVTLGPKAMKVYQGALLRTIFGGLDAYALLAVPFFVFAGELMAASGIADRLIALSIPGEANTLPAEATAAGARAVGLAAETADTALHAVQRIAAEIPQARILICGSLYLAGAIIMCWNLWMTVTKGEARKDAPLAAPAE